MPFPQGILLDIEGTTSSISFVYDVMFPYVREHLADFVAKNWNEAAVQDCLPLLAADLGHAEVTEWLDLKQPAATLQAEVNKAVIGFMDADVKATGLKKLQGAIWKSGFESGQMVAHVYDDVAPAIKNWVESGSEVRIYSSGSVQAQKLFFGHTVAGDLLDRFNGHYDTTTGPKKELKSYEIIAQEFSCPASDVLFISDVVAELDAAHAAGLQTALSIRPGNKPAGEHSFRSIESFAEIG